MTAPLLEYQSATGPSRLRAATWVYLLILGILYALGSACVGTGMILTLQGTSGMMSGGTRLSLICFTVALVGGGFATAITYIWTGVRIKRGSRKAAIVALIAGLINVGFIVALLGVIAVNLMQGKRGPIIAIVVGTGFYVFVAALNGAAAMLARRVLREHRGGPA